MGNRNKDRKEKTFQENFVKEMEKYRWEAPDFLDGNKHKVTVDDLIEHWRKELNRINADQLEGVPLTDNEFRQVMEKVNKISNSYEAAKLLAIEDATGKIDGIYRDKNPKVSRQQITLTIFRKAEVRGGDSSYRIAREVSTPRGNRFDIVLLINGLPLINIEQKRADVTTDEAFGQFKRYYRDGEYCNNFMAFSQMMVICSEIETRYFATPKSEADFNMSFVFGWADKSNRPINNWKEVIEHFLMIPMAHQMVGDYLVIDESSELENRRHMLMRPYQVYALQAVESAAFGYDNKDRISHGGFVWHTTGSGKTITSFKTALFLSTRAGFDKVIFLVDRRELDSRTSENFKAYAKYEPVEVDDTASTHQLKKVLSVPRNGIVVTTTFKLNSLVKEMEEKQDNKLADKRFVFIIDEAHRTTMGQMMGTIKEYFRKNGLFFGFTGTPLFDENKAKGMIEKRGDKSELINTTEKLFGPLLHQYTIDEAIADKNVLGFHVDYINTGEFRNYEELRERYAEKLKAENPKMSSAEIERKAWEVSELQLENEKLFSYNDDTHIPRVVERILENWDFQSQNREFNAILTVAYKPRVIAYYHEFKKQLEEKNMSLNIAMTFSFGNENESHTDKADVTPEIKEEMFADYEKFTGILFAEGDGIRGESDYFEDVVERATRGGSGRNPKNIDLVIVADQLLTGYDSKRLNTLYVDRKLELQGLIQAYSRTNRVFGPTKEFGTIINFKYPRRTEETVNTALRLYGSGGENSGVIVDHYDVAKEKLIAVIPKMLKALNNPSDWQLIIRDDKEREEFKKAFRKVSKQMRILQQYYEFEWDDESFGFTEHDWSQYIGAYKNIRRDEPKEKPEETGGLEDEIKELTGKTILVGVQIIDANYILRLIGEKIVKQNGKNGIDDESLRIIHETIQELSNQGEDHQAKMLKQFVDEEIISGKLEEGISIDEAFENWKNTIVDKEVERFAGDYGIDEGALKKSLVAFEVREEVVPYNAEIISSVDVSKAAKAFPNQLMLNIALQDELPKWLAEMKEKYDI